MATRRYGVSPAESFTQVSETVGAATAADSVELTVDLAQNIGTDKGPRGVSRHEVLWALEKIKVKILNDPWPPA